MEAAASCMAGRDKSIAVASEMAVLDTVGREDMNVNPDTPRKYDH